MDDFGSACSNCASCVITLVFVVGVIAIIWFLASVCGGGGDSADTELGRCYVLAREVDKLHAAGISDDAVLATLAEKLDMTEGEVLILTGRCHDAIGDVEPTPGFGDGARCTRCATPPSSTKLYPALLPN